MEKQSKKDELVLTLTVVTRQISEIESRMKEMRDLVYRVAEAITDFEEVDDLPPF